MRQTPTPLHISTDAAGSVAYEVEVAQKAPLWLRLTAHGPAGHGSSPRPDAATHVEKISLAPPLSAKQRAALDLLCDVADNGPYSFRMMLALLEALADGQTGLDLELLRHALEVFTTLYHEHVSLEESLIYPAARRQQAAEEAAAARRRSQHA